MMSSYGATSYGALDDVELGKGAEVMVVDEVVDPQIELEARELTVATVRSDPSTEVTLLDGVTCGFAPGTLSAVLGPSGAGKTSLFRALSGRLPANWTRNGGVWANGALVREGEFKEWGSVAPQDDVLLTALTPRELLTYAALMRGASSLRVDFVLASLELEPCADTFASKISGGQRRRTSLGLELVHAPSVLLADEPTSGLDARSARLVIEKLKAMATTSKTTAICTIHQPSRDIFETFDKIIVMAKGRVCFVGHTQAAVSYFNYSHLLKPKHEALLAINAAEAILECVGDDPAAAGDAWRNHTVDAKVAPGLATSSPPGLSKGGSAGHVQAQTVAPAAAPDDESPGADAEASASAHDDFEEADAASKARPDVPGKVSSPSSSGGASVKKTTTSPKTPKGAGPAMTLAEATTASARGLSSQMAALLGSVGASQSQSGASSSVPPLAKFKKRPSAMPWIFSRSMTNTWRGVGTLQIRASAFTALFISILFWRGQDTQRRGALLLGAYFLSTIFMGIFTVNTTITLVPSEVPTLRREYYNGLYTVGEYLTARLAVAGLIQTAACFAYMIVFYPLIHRGGYGGDGQAKFLVTYLALLLLGLTANLIGVLIGSVAPNQTVATIAVSPAVVPPLMCAGYFFHKNDLTKNVQHVIYPFWYLSYLRYCFYIVVTNEFRDGTFEVCNGTEYCPYNSYVVDPDVPVNHDVVAREYLDIPQGTVLPWFFFIQLGFIVGLLFLLVFAINKVTLRTD